MATKPKRKPDRRPTLTIKGDGFGPEFRALLNKAAKKRGMTQAAFVAEVLDREARKVLQGTVEDDSAPPLPAVMERIADNDKKLAELADQVQRLTAMQQRSIWQRIWGKGG